MDLHAAYLDLLKRALCDLLGPRVLSASPQPGTSNVVAELLPSERMELRETGADWPMNGTTMVGLRRLDNVQRCLEAIVRDGVEGDVIETGVWRGGTSIFMRALLDTLADERTVWLADSFQGLPLANPEEFPLDAGSDPHFAFDFLSASQEEVKAAFERFGVGLDGTRFLQGWFRDTLPTVRDRAWSLIRLDGDMYESTIQGLENLYPGVAVGGFVIVDDYGAIPQCKQAVHDFRAAHGIDDPIEQVDWTGAVWRRSA